MHTNALNIKSQNYIIIINIKYSTTKAVTLPIYNGSLVPPSDTK